MKDIFRYHAEVCKTLANPKRLEIIYALKDGEKSVGELVAELGLPKANVSQHLSVLRGCGVVKCRREGQSIFYTIANRKIIEACALMREVLIERLEEDSRILGKLGS
ncbi:MAG TPA: ArsR family transcriptional regulator [Deltaproteobacteria bacterium]|nr:ArsR family transcriptional regulator [Deltaproteobacteria bacterium]